MPRPRVLRQAGVTLAEMLVVTAVLSIAAGIAIPTASPLASIGGDTAATEITSAIRFAQREAVRTGAWHTVKFDATAQTLRVYRLAAGGAEDTTLPVVHPIDKRPYLVAFGAGVARATIVLVDFDYKGGNTNLNTLSFGPDGAPGIVTGSKATDFKGMDTGIVGIKSANGQRNFVIDTVTGRVSG